MAIEVTMPKLSDTMEEGKILKWLAKEGDEVSSGDVIAEIETDKADMEMEAFEDGVLVKIVKGEGESAAVGVVIAYIGEAGEAVEAPPAAPKPDKEKEEKAEEEEKPAAESEPEKEPVKEEAEPEPEKEPAKEKAEPELPEEEPVKEAEKEPPKEEAEPEPEKEPAKEKAEPEPEEEPAKEKAEPEPEKEPAKEKAEPEPEEEPVKEAEKEPPKKEAPPAKEEKIAPAPAPAVTGAEVKASPLARRLADAAGVDIASIKGSGPDGRVVKRDIEAHLGGKLPELEPARPKEAEEPAAATPPEPKAVPAPPKELAGKRVPMSSMRKTIAKRLTESVNTIPHYYVTVSVDMSAVMEARELIEKQEDVKLSVNDFIIKACAKALVEHPQVNARIEGDDVVYLDTVDIGVAVALEDGLITPVVRDCLSKSLLQISSEVRELAERARARKLQPEEYTGAGFSISNLGMFGVDQFTAIISPPEAAILAVGRVEEIPVVVNGAVTVGTRMKMTMSNDHRIIDGAVSAQFLATVKEILERPMRMLV